MAIADKLAEIRMKAQDQAGKTSLIIYIYIFQIEDLGKSRLLLTPSATILANNNLLSASMYVVVVEHRLSWNKSIFYNLHELFVDLMNDDNHV